MVRPRKISQTCSPMPLGLRKRFSFSIPVQHWDTGAKMTKIVLETSGMTHRWSQTNQRKSERRALQRIWVSTKSKWARASMLLEAAQDIGHRAYAQELLRLSRSWAPLPSEETFKRNGKRRPRSLDEIPKQRPHRQTPRVTASRHEPLPVLPSCSVRRDPQDAWEWSMWWRQWRQHCNRFGGTISRAKGITRLKVWERSHKYRSRLSVVASFSTGVQLEQGFSTGLESASVPFVYSSRSPDYSLDIRQYKMVLFEYYWKDASKSQTREGDMLTAENVPCSLHRLVSIMMYSRHDSSQILHETQRIIRLMFEFEIWNSLVQTIPHTRLYPPQLQNRPGFYGRQEALCSAEDLF